MAGPVVPGATVVGEGVLVGGSVTAGPAASVGVPAVGEGVTLGSGVRGPLVTPIVGAGVGGAVCKTVMLSTIAELTVQTRPSPASLT